MIWGTPILGNPHVFLWLWPEWYLLVHVSYCKETKQMRHAWVRQAALQNRWSSQLVCEAYDRGDYEEAVKNWMASLRSVKYLLDKKLSLALNMSKKYPVAMVVASLQITDHDFLTSQVCPQCWTSKASWAAQLNFASPIVCLQRSLLSLDSAHGSPMLTVSCWNHKTEKSCFQAAEFSNCRQRGSVEWHSECKLCSISQKSLALVQGIWLLA